MVCIFRKRLSRTDIKYRLHVPVEAFRVHFPPIIHGNTVKIRIRDPVNGEYTLTCYIRTGADPYDKPVISGSWRHIASARGYAVGDVLLFHKEQDLNGCSFYSFDVERDP